MKNRHNPLTFAALILAVICCAACLSSTLSAQTVDLEKQRLPVSSIAADWRFHPGDDPGWSQPAFDDATWKLIQLAREWTAQGYSEQNNMAWFRFRLLVPPNTPSLVIQMPHLNKSYQLFADGRLIGQAGRLPPDHPFPAFAPARVYTVPVQPGTKPRQVTLALRLWQEPRLIGLTANILSGRAMAGESAPMLRLFANANATTLLSRGSDYTQDVVVVVVGMAALLLFSFTRETFYLWFALNMLTWAALLPIQLASQHFTWNYFTSIYAYILEDFLSAVTLVFFLMGALQLTRRRELALPILLGFLAETGPLLLLTSRLPLAWADGIYFVFVTAMEALLVWYLVRGWRQGNVDAKLLLFPYLIGNFFGELGNLAHFLVDLNVPHADKLITANMEVLNSPFSVSVSDLGNTVSLLGFLAVLVHRFARTSREQQRLASALQAAHDVQHRLVPVDIPSLGGLQTEIVYLAAEEVGGDFCQVLPRPDGSILIAIGDVSGKGLQAAMLGTLAVGALRSIADETIEPVDALYRLNQVILRTGNAGFITCLCLKLSPAGQVTLANAGHLSPYLNGQEVSLPPGLPLGIIPDVVYQQLTFMLPATARFTLLSDGVVEARSRSGELFGFDRTSRVSQLPASEIAAAAHHHGQEDDITIITLDWREPLPASA